MTERWLPVVGYEGFYEISSDGNLRSLERITKRGRRGGKHMKPQLTQGYPTFLLTAIALKKRQRKSAHRMVLEAFIGPCPDGMEACHFPDRDPANCRLLNLRWDTKEGNFSDKPKHGTQTKGENHPVSLLTEKQAKEILLLKGLPIKETAAQFGVSSSTVSYIQRGKRWSHLQESST